MKAPNLCSRDICTGNFYQTILVPYRCHLKICMNQMRPSAGKRRGNHCKRLSERQTKPRLVCTACSPLDVHVCTLCVLGSSLGALEVSVSVTASDMESSVLQTSSRSHRENTSRGRWGPVATCTISASQLALSYVAKQIWPLILCWPVYAQISSTWGQKGGKESITVRLLFKGTIRMVDSCITL